MRGISWVWTCNFLSHPRRFLRAVFFAIYARPITYDEPTNHNSRRSSTRSFYTDQTGVIRYTGEDRLATVDDTPLGK